MEMQGKNWALVGLQGIVGRLMRRQYYPAKMAFMYWRLKTIQKSQDLSISDVRQQRKIAEELLIQRKIKDCEKILANFELEGIEDAK